MQPSKQDFGGVRGKRELVIAVFGGVLAVPVLLVVGAPEAAVEQVIVVVVAAFSAAILFPACEFTWAWLQAPMRMLQEDVAAIRERVEMPVLGSPESVDERRPELRVAVNAMIEELMYHKRRIERAKDGLPPIEAGDTDGWFAWLDGRDVLARSGHAEALSAARRAYHMLEVEDDESPGKTVFAIHDAIELLTPLLGNEGQS